MPGSTLYLLNQTPSNQLLFMLLLLITILSLFSLINFITLSGCCKKILHRFCMKRGNSSSNTFPENLKIMNNIRAKEYFVTPFTSTNSVLSYTLTLTAVLLTRVTLLLQRYLGAIFLYTRNMYNMYYISLMFVAYV